MPLSLSEPAGLLPWVYLLALIPVALWARYRTTSDLWLPAVVAGSAGVALVALAILVAVLDSQPNDRLGLVMAALISFLALVIINFSRRYLQGEAGQLRYCLALLVTLAAVAVVVTTDSLYWLVAAWIVSSLSLHQLLIFYRHRVTAQVVAHKKFLVSRLADLCLLLATGLLVKASGDSSISAMLDWVSAQSAGQGGLGWDVQLATLLLGMAVILKSAQLPFHGLLIQVMEAPTPVSALLHAGLVNLGGFMVLRFAPLFSAVPSAQTLLVIVGGTTAVLAALVMMTRISIKVRLAWSTCAQMGFMLMELGLGLYEVALVHLLAHSLYKAHAFLASGDTVNQAERHALQPERPAAGLKQTLLALPMAALAVLLLHGLWTLWQPQHALPLVALVILTVGLAPWCFRLAGAFHATAMLSLLLALYLLWHQAAALILGGYPAPSGFQSGLAVLVVLLFVALYVSQAWITERPTSAFARRLYPWAYAGFYLDEYLTRVTFRLWPPARNAISTQSKGVNA